MSHALSEFTIAYTVCDTELLKWTAISFTPDLDQSYMYRCGITMLEQPRAVKDAMWHFDNIQCIFGIGHLKHQQKEIIRKDEIFAK